MYRLLFLVMTLLLAGCANQEANTVSNKLEKFVENYKNSNFSGTILVADNGGIVFEKSFGMADYENNIPNETDTIFRIGSVSKQFTAMGIMMLQEKGLLDVNDKVSKFIPDYPNGDNISIHHLLTMSSGVADEIDILFPKYDFSSGTFLNADKPTRKDEYFTPLQLIDLFKNKPLHFTPGKTFEYSNSNYILLGYIIEKVSNTSYEDFLKNNIFTPLGMDNSGVDHNEVLPTKAVGYDKIIPNPLKTFSYSMSTSFASAGLYSTVEDLYKWDQALYTEKLVKKDTLLKMFKPYTKIREITDLTYHSYGYGWMVNDLAKKPQVEHTGIIPGFSSYLFHGEESKRTIIILSNSAFFSPNIFSFKDEILGILNMGGT